MSKYTSWDKGQAIADIDDRLKALEACIMYVPSTFTPEVVREIDARIVAPAGPQPGQPASVAELVARSAAPENMTPLHMKGCGQVWVQGK